MIKRKTSSNRLVAREAEKKLQPAIKHISAAIHNTQEFPEKDKFRGYKLSAGELVDKRGRKWQLQVHAVVAKRDILKRDTLTPVFSNSFSIMVKSFIKQFLDNLFS